MGPLGRAFTQVPMPAALGIVTGFPVQNRSTLQAFGSTSKISRVAMSAARIPGSLFGGRVVTLIFGVFMVTAGIEGRGRRLGVRVSY